MKKPLTQKGIAIFNSPPSNNNIGDALLKNHLILE